MTISRVRTIWWAWLVILLSPIAAAPGSTREKALTIVTFGDSTTALRKGFDVYTSQLDRRFKSAAFPVTLVNAGKGGDSTSMARKRFATDVIRRKPDLVIIQFGINDSVINVWKKPPATRPEISLSEYEENLRFFVSEVRRSGGQPVLMTPNPLRWTPKLRAIYGKAPYDPGDEMGLTRPMEPYVAVVRRLAVDLNVPLVDVYALFEQWEREHHQSCSQLMSDGMHPNTAGHTLIADALAKIIEPMLAAGAAAYSAVADEATASPPRILEIQERMGPMTRLSDGRLFAVYGEGRPESEWDDLSIPQNLFGRFSADDGADWTAPKLILPMPPGPGAAACAVTSGGALVLADRHGTIHMFGCRYYDMPSPKKRKPGSNGTEDYFKARTELWYTSSRDGGVAWAPLRNIDYGQRYTGALNSFIELRSGRMLLPFSYLSRARHRGFFVSTAIYSDDNGKTWVPSRNDMAVDCGGVAIESGAPEPVSVELPDGRVWTLIRTQTGYLFESYSTDGGETWSPPRRTIFRSPNAPGGVVRLRDGRLVLVWNDEFGPPFANDGVSYSRQSLVAAILDGGRWRGYRELVTFGPDDNASGHGGARYPYLLEAQNGHVLVAYSEDGRVSRRKEQWAAWKDERIVDLDPRWLLETKSVEDFSQGTEQLQLSGSKGVDIARDENGRSFLRLRKEVGAPSGLTWNFPFGQSGTLHIQMRANSGFGGVHCTLSESFPAPTNCEGGMFQWVIGPDLRLGTRYVSGSPLVEIGRSRSSVKNVVGTLQSGRVQDLTVEWNCETNVAQLLVDGNFAATLVGLEGHRGIAYLRLALMAKTADPDGLQVLGFRSESRP